MNTFGPFINIIKHGSELLLHCQNDLYASIFLKVSDRAEHLGSGLLHKGLKPNPDTFIGIFAQNRPEVRMGNAKREEEDRLT